LFAAPFAVSHRRVKKVGASIARSLESHVHKKKEIPGAGVEPARPILPGELYANKLAGDKTPLKLLHRKAQLLDNN
jgi:hypothetical protein